MRVMQASTPVTMKNAVIALTTRDLFNVDKSSRCSIIVCENPFEGPFNSFLHDGGVERMVHKGWNMHGNAGT